MFAYKKIRGPNDSFAIFAVIFIRGNIYAYGKHLSIIYISSLSVQYLLCAFLAKMTYGCHLKEGNVAHLVIPHFIGLWYSCQYYRPMKITVM